MLSPAQRQEIETLKSFLQEGLEKLEDLNDMLMRDLLPAEDYQTAHDVIHDLQIGVAILHDSVKFLRDVQITEQTSRN